MKIPTAETVVPWVAKVEVTERNLLQGEGGRRLPTAFRETREAVVSFQERGVLAVEMELSALLSVGMFHDVDVSALLVVSDELSSLTWKPGFKSDRFKQGRNDAASIVNKLCRELT